MPNAALTAAIKEAYASAPSNVVILNTLELSHPAFSLVREKLDYILCIDRSGSMESSISAVRVAIANLVASLEANFAKGVRIAVIAYGQSADGGAPELIVDLTTPALALAALDTITTSGGTERALDAVKFAFENVTVDPALSTAKVVMVVQNSEDTNGDTATEGEIDTLLTNNNATFIYGVEDTLSTLQRLADDHNGDYIENDDDFETNLLTAITTIPVTAGTDSIYMVRARKSYDLTLENSEVKTFEPVGFDFTLPPAGDKGLQELSVALDNTDRRISDFLNAVKEFSAPAKLTYRPYLSNDLTTPQINPPLKLNLTDVKVTVEKVTGRATFADLINKKHPRQLYTRRRFPSLGG